MGSKNNGECFLCGEEFSRQGMSRHLTSCIKKYGRGEQNHCYHLFVDAEYTNDYWLHLLVKKACHLYQLDAYLRRIWLECCGHLSAFTIDGNLYSSKEDLFMGPSSYQLDVLLKDVLSVGLKFHYEYDFGSTTELTIKVLGERPMVQNKEILLLSRNHPPLIQCSCCGKPAIDICTQCIYEGEGYLCGDCSSEHHCGEEMLLPVVNSPRAGVCGYCGEG